MKIDLNLFENLTEAIHKACIKASIDEYICQVFGSNLAGACGIASFGLWEKLISKDYFPDFVYGTYKNRDHCWVKCDKYIIDPTFKQFDHYNPWVISNHHAHRPCLLNKDAFDFLWLWSEQSPKHYYFEWKSDKECKLFYKESLLDIENIL